MHSTKISPIFKSFAKINQMAMGKKKTQPFPYKSSSQTPSSSSWSWPSACTNPKTLSFRAPQDIFKTMSSTFLNTTNSKEFVEIAPELIFLEEVEEEDSTEEVIRGLKLEERLVFEPGETSSILKAGRDYRDMHDVVKTRENGLQFKESLATSVESINPFADFKKSMEEMVEAHGLKDWDCLEELLTCYLKVNCKSNHGYIIGAFVELLVGLGFVASSFSRSHSHNSFTSPLSYPSSSNNSSNSPCLSSLEVDDDVEKPANNVVVVTS